MEELTRKEFLKLSSMAVASAMMPKFPSNDFEIIDRPSRWRKSRPIRESTDYIFLHTTEGGFSGSLNKLLDRGEANYLINTNGDTYRLLHPDQISYGAGRKSMWKDTERLDDHAVNIEVVGYYNKELTRSQLASGKELIRLLRSTRPWIRDQDVMPHSMVAYGTPNKWHPYMHRGRKRCGMQFARDDIREKLGIAGGLPEYDPDVRAGRLVAADPYLEEALYGDQNTPLAARKPTEEQDIESANFITTIEQGDGVWAYTGNKFDESSTIYLFESGTIRRGDQLKEQGFDFEHINPGLRIAIGYVDGGHVKNERSAYSIAGKKWDDKSTIYRFPSGQIKYGNEVSEETIPPMTRMLFRK